MSPVIRAVPKPISLGTNTVRPEKWSIYIRIQPQTMAQGGFLAHR
ncbi:MAG: hypothetical protein V3U43_05350 [Pseudomonadales bacterium]